jgi:hypothetical protein
MHHPVQRRGHVDDEHALSSVGRVERVHAYAREERMQVGESPSISLAARTIKSKVRGPAGAPSS